MNIDQAIALLQKRKEEIGGDVDVTTLEYAGGDDAMYTVDDFVFDEATGTLLVRTTVYR